MKENKSMPDGVVFLNYKQSTNTNIPAVTEIPIGNKKILDKLTQGDTSPMFKSEAIDYPVIGTGGVYEKSFFQSFINVCKERPIPGSKRGHEFTSRPSNDFYMVGGQLIPNADGKTGTAVFLMYIPPFGDTTDNTGFKRDADAGIVNFSLVTQPEYNVKKDDDGVERRHFTKTNGYERNDAVEYGAGAMSQVVNSKQNEIDFDELKKLVTNGKYSRKNIDDEIIQNGKVSYPVLRSMIARADCENKTEIGNILSIIDKSSNGRKLMDAELQEAVERVQNAAKNGSIVISDVFKNAGIALRTDDDKKNEETVKTLNAKNLGADPLAAIDTLIAQNKANSDAIAKNEVATAFGAEKVKNAKGEEVENPAYTYAFEKCSGKSGDSLKNEIEAVKNSAVMKGIRANQADPFSKINMIENGGAADTAKNAANVAVAY